MILLDSGRGNDLRLTVVFLLLMFEISAINIPTVFVQFYRPGFVEVGLDDNSVVVAVHGYQGYDVISCVSVDD